MSAKVFPDALRAPEVTFVIKSLVIILVYIVNNKYLIKKFVVKTTEQTTDSK